jgi:hypothetical protein
MDANPPVNEDKSERDTGLDYLLGLDGEIQVQNDEGYWVKFAVARVDVTPQRPHGIRYSLTLHDPDGNRLMGFDNAHGGVKPAGSRFKHTGKRFAFDHRHRHATDEGVLYEFDTAYKLVEDFYSEVDRVLKEILC